MHIQSSKEINAKIRKAFKTFRKDIKKAAVNLGHDINTTAKGVIHTIKTVGNDVVHGKIGNASKDLGHGLKEGAKNVGDDLKGAVDFGASMTGANAGLNLAKQGSPKVAEGIDKAEHVVGKVQSSVIDGTANAIGDVANDTRKTTGDVVDTTGHVVKDVAHGDFKGAKDELGSGAKQVTKNVGKTLEDDGKLAINAPVPGLGEIGMAKDVAEAGIETAKVVKGGEALGETTKAGADTAAKKSPLKEIGETAKDSAADAIPSSPGESDPPENSPQAPSPHHNDPPSYEDASLPDAKNAPYKHESGTYGQESFGGQPSYEAPPAYDDRPGAPTLPRSGTYDLGSFNDLKSDSPPLHNEAPPAYDDRSYSYAHHSALYDSKLQDQSATDTPPNTLEREASPITQNHFDQSVMAESREDQASYPPDAYNEKALPITKLDLPGTTIPVSEKAPTLVRPLPEKLLNFKTPIVSPRIDMGTMGRV